MRMGMNIVRVGVILFIAVANLAAQVSSRRAAFDVATIRPSRPDSAPMAIRRNNSQFTTSNTSLPFLIRWAYDIDEQRLIGVPKGLYSLTFDIIAKIPDEKLAPGQLQLMMQSLL